MTLTRRPTASLILLLLGSTLAGAAQASPTDECRTGARYTAAQAEIDAALKTVGEGGLRNQARLESQLKASGATRGWSQEQQAEMLRKAYSSAGYWELEKAKQPHVSALMQAVTASSGPDPRVSKCTAAKQVKASAWAVADIHGRQYAYVAREVGISQGIQAKAR
ncbi:MAG: hypothetical protein V4679_19105 [Pseudomonadota bacterium]